jgi:hypothetical protein
MVAFCELLDWFRRFIERALCSTLKMQLFGRLYDEFSQREGNYSNFGPNRRMVEFCELLEWFRRLIERALCSARKMQ